MANEFVQRQITGFIAPGAGTNPNQFDPASYTWQIQDVYPSTVMKLDPGKYTSGELIVPTSGTAVILIPNQYLSARQLSVFIETDTVVKCTTISPAHSTSIVMIVPGPTSGQRGIFSFVDRVTSITLSNASGTDATVNFSTWEYPDDINVPDAWQGGNETIGTVSA